MRMLLVALVLLPFSQLGTSPTEGDPQAGDALWNGAATLCRNCHGSQGEGAFGPDLAGRALTVAQFRQAVRQPWGIMPGYTTDQLSNQDLADIRAYLMTRPPVAGPGPWRFSVPAEAPPGQELALATIGCGQCHGPTMNGPRADAGAIDADFAWFTEMVYEHSTVMPQHRALLEEAPFFVRMGNYARNRIPESLVEEIWRFMLDLGFRANLAARLGPGTSGVDGVGYPLTVENIGLPGKGLTAEEVTVLVALPSGATVVSASGPGYQGVSHDPGLDADVAVWRVTRLRPKDRLAYSITLADSGEDTLGGVVRWVEPPIQQGGDGDQINITQTP